MEFVGGLLPLVIIAAIIAAIVSAVRKRTKDREPGAPGVSSRQAFFYLFSFAALMVAAAGGSVLVSYIVDSLRGGELVSPSDNQLALGLALTIVGTPAWALTWRRILKSTAATPYERSSDVRGLYVYLIELVSISFIAFGLVSLINVILGTESLNGTDVAWPVIWGLVWGYHWWLESGLTDTERAATPFRSLYVYLLSMASLVLLLVGVGIIINRLLDSAYVSLFLDGDFIRTSLWGDTIKTGIALGLVGAVSWWHHWFKATGEQPGIMLRQVYIYIFGVLFGFVTVVVTVSTVLVLVLQWLLSTPTIQPADEHFRSLTGLVPAMLAGVMLWTYHAEVMKHEVAGAAKESALRVYNYIIAGLSLATLSTGFIFLVALFISASSRDARDYIGETGWQGQLSVVLTLLLFGGAIWAYYWMRMQRSAQANPADLETTSRKLHIYSVFGISALAALGSLSTALYMFLQAILDSDLSTATLRDAQWALAVLLTTGVVSGYYWLVIKEDRRLLSLTEPVKERRKKHVTVLVQEAARATADELERRLGYGVTTWLLPDGAIPVAGTAAGTATPVAGEEITGGPRDAVPAATLSGTLIDEALADIDAAPTDRVLVTVEGNRLKVTPYRRD